MEKYIQNWTLQEYKIFLRKLIKLLREKNGISQLNLSEKLGNNSNVIYKMESSKNRILWNDLISILHILDIDINNLFKQYFSYNKDLKDLKKLITLLFKNFSKKELSQELNIGLKSFTRSLEETNSIEAHYIFFLLGKFFPRMIELIADIDYPDIPIEISKEYTMRKELRKLIGENPWIGVLRLYFRENKIKNLNEKTIHQISIDLAQSNKSVTQTIEKLKKQNLLSYCEKEKRWSTYRHDLLVQNKNKPSNLPSIYWGERILKKQKQLDKCKKTDDPTSLTVTFSTSKENLKEVKSLVTNFSSQLRNTLNLHRETNTELCVLTINLADISKLEIED